MSLTVTLNTLYNFTSSVELFTNTSRVRINRRVSVVERVEDIAAQVLLMRTAAVSLVQTGTLVGISIRCRSVPFPKPHYGSRHSSFSHYGTRTMNSGHREAPCETIAESRDLISPILIPNSVYIEANHSLVSYFPVQVNETRTTEFALGRQAREDEKKEDYYANVGDAIRTLREDIPQMFRKELDYSIYREDIVFRDQNLEFRGIKNYKIIFWSLKFHGKLFFKHMHVDILRIWQPEDYIIKMRWQVHGFPRVWWEAEGRIDGISTYKLDKKGKIYEHMVDNVQLRDPPITNPLLYGLNYIFESPTNQPQSIPMPGS